MSFDSQTGELWCGTPDCATNNNLSYARSRDLIHWETAAGRPVELPMTLETDGMIVDPAASGSGMINGGQKLVFDSRQRPMIACHKSDDAGNMQIHLARFEDGKWNRRVLSTWDQSVEFAGRGAMPFIGIRVSAPQRIDRDVWSVSYRHRDLGSGALTFSEKTLRPVEATVPKPRTELPAELHRPQISFKSIGVRQAHDLGNSGDPDVRYIMKWDVLPANHDRKRSSPLPLRPLCGSTNSSARSPGECALDHQSGTRSPPTGRTIVGSGNLADRRAARPRMIG